MVLHWMWHFLEIGFHLKFGLQFFRMRLIFRYIFFFWLKVWVHFFVGSVLTALFLCSYSFIRNEFTIKFEWTQFKSQSTFFLPRFLCGFRLFSFIFSFLAIFLMANFPFSRQLSNLRSGRNNYYVKINRQERLQSKRQNHRGSYSVTVEFYSWCFSNSPIQNTKVISVQNFSLSLKPHTIF